MPGNRLSNDLRWAVVRLITMRCHVDFVAAALGISERTITRIMSIFHASGGARVRLDIGERPGQGRPRALSYRELWVSSISVNLQ